MPAPDSIVDDRELAALAAQEPADVDQVVALLGEIATAERWYPHRHRPGHRAGPPAMLDVAATKIAQILV